MANKRYTLVLNFGYVENAHLGFMPWTSAGTFKDAKDALLDLANYLKERYLVDMAPPLKKCCKASKSKDTEADFCSKCGVSLRDDDFDGEAFSDWLRRLDSDINSFHGMIEWDPDARWQSDGLEDAPNPRYVYHADWVLAAAVGCPIREDVTFEDICKARTRSKKQSFSYYH